MTEIDQPTITVIGPLSKHWTDQDCNALLRALLPIDGLVDGSVTVLPPETPLPGGVDYVDVRGVFQAKSKAAALEAVNATLEGIAKDRKTMIRTAPMVMTERSFAADLVVYRSLVAFVVLNQKGERWPASKTEVAAGPKDG